MTRVACSALGVAAVAAPVAFGVVVAVVVAGSLPAVAAWCFVMVLTAVTLLLAHPPAEAVLSCAPLMRPLSEIERDVLAPAAALMCRAGLGPPRFHLRVGRSGTLLAVPGGRRSVALQPAMLFGLQRGSVSPREAAASMCHAAAAAGAAGFVGGAAVGLWCLPWRVLAWATTPVRRFAVGRWAMALGWPVGVVAEGQLVFAGHPGLGAVVAALAVVPVLHRAATRAWARAVEQAADEAVIELGLGGELLEVLRKAGCPVDLTRWRRLQGDAPATASAAKVLQLMPSPR